MNFRTVVHGVEKRWVSPEGTTSGVGKHSSGGSQVSSVLYCEQNKKVQVRGSGCGFLCTFLPGLIKFCVRWRGWVVQLIAGGRDRCPGIGVCGGWYEQRMDAG